MEVIGISIVAVPVDDIDEALDFFYGTLGMEKRKDLSGSEGRYIEVAPPGSPVALSPYTGYHREPGKATIGEYSRVVLRVADIHAAHEELTARGVRFEREPFELPGGTYAALRDPWDNLFVLAETRGS